MKKKFWGAGIAAAVLAAGVLFSYPMDVLAARIPDGVYVGDQNLGGMTKEEAEKTISEYVKGLENQKITLNVDGQAVETTAGELGFHWSNQDAVDQATDVLEGGNLIKRYMVIKDIEQNPVKIPLATAVEQEKVAAFVEEKCASVTTPAKNATITRTDGKFVVTESAVGKTVDIEATRNALDQALAAGLDNPITVTAVVAESQPTITAEALSTIGNVLGTFSTDYSSSGASRSTNLKVGAAKINGHLLMPGETLSGYECMKPFTTENGYATAASYENGQVVDSIGGGVCQIATTLYNASLRAEVKISQRQNHSMVVGYVKPSEDAAIAGTYKDIKITNNYSTPIYVEGSTAGRKLTFTIYGKDTRPSNRTFKFVSETLDVTDPGAPTEQFDASLAPGKRVQVQSAHKGLKSRLWKYIYVDGVEQSKEILHTDTYNASKAVIKVGPAAASKPAAPAPSTPVAPTPEPTQPAPTAPPETEAPKPVEGVNGGPGVSAPPSEEPAAGPGA